MRLSYSLLFALLFSSYANLTAESWNEIAPSERSFLQDFYAATDGWSWPNDDNWFSGNGKPFGLTLVKDRDIPPGEDPVYLVSAINFASNGIGGALAGDWASLKALSSLYLFNNRIGGRFPLGIMQLETMRWIDLEKNELSGTLPDGFGELPAGPELYEFNIYNNNFSGNLPSTLGSMTSLTALYLGRNQFTGPIPASLGEIPFLRSLQLEHNKLTGPLPDALANLGDSLQIFRAYNNELEGTLPEWLGSFIHVERLMLGSNNFVGDVPASFSNLVNTRFISIPYNNLTDFTAIAGIVDNEGFALTEVDVRGNKIDFSEGSPNEAARLKLQAAGVRVLRGGQQRREKPTEVGMALRAMDPMDYSLDVKIEGLQDIDAKLVPPEDLTKLKQQRIVQGGLVADGVTPLLIDYASLFDGNTSSYNIEFDFPSGGSVAQPLQHYFLGENGWEATNQITFTASSDQVFGYIGAVKSDDVYVSSDAPEVVCEIIITDGDGVICGRERFRLRKPPVTLIHGYNTDGDWGSAILRRLGATRPDLEVFNLDPEVGNTEDFLIVVRYGQKKPGTVNQAIDSVSTSLGNHENTLLPLVALVPVLDAKLQELLAPLHTEWAFTRHDVVAHSQGGLLARMLATQEPVPFVVYNGEEAVQSLPFGFRGLHNAFRGRFHRVITIGSPHNGSRLLAYINKLDLNPSVYRYIPEKISNLAIFSGKAQDKFDPFGLQIRALNNPAGPWIPDPAAKFHLVQTTIYGGKAPDPADTSYIARLLQLNDPEATKVLPRGYDGIVDFDSMGAYGPGQPKPANVYTLPPNNEVSHSGPASLFDQAGVPTVGQTASDAVAEHVTWALEPLFAPEPQDILFGPFPMPPLLDASIEAGIVQFAQPDDQDADLVLLADLIGVPDLQQLEAFHVGPGRSSYSFQITPPADLPPSGAVQWDAEWWNELGVNAVGVTIVPSESNPLRVTLEVGTEIIGDLVLYASYTAENGSVVMGKPLHVASIDPASPAVKLHLLPEASTLPTGDNLRPEFIVEYADGTFMRRYMSEENLSVTASPASRMDVSDPLEWKALNVGPVTVSVQWKGLQSEMAYAILDTLDAGWTDWRELYFSPAQLLDPSISAPGEDPDADGYVNLIEKLTGYHPLQPDGADRLEASDWLGTRLLLLSLGLSNSDVHFVLEGSPTPFGPWNPILDSPGDPSGLDQGNLFIEPGDLGRQLIMSLPGSGDRFYRLTAELADAP
jgi:hypothetical protein